MKKIFILNGSGGVGKDTFVQCVKDYTFRIKDKYVQHISSVDKVKTAAKNIGWNGEKDEKGRKFLSDIKMALSDYDDSPFKYIENQVEFFRMESYYGVLFIDIREPEEIERAKKEFGAQTILITSNRVEQVTSNMADAGVHEYQYDIVIENNGTLEDLFDSAIKFSQEFIFK